MNPSGPADPSPRRPSLWRRLFARIKALAERVARFFRPEITAGRFETGRATSWRGFVTTAPMVPPERDYLVYVPRGYTRWRRAPLFVLCHGCRQSPEDLVALASVTSRADREGWLVLLPQQSEAANRYQCWNWFETSTFCGSGEAAIVAAQIIAVRRHYRARRERVWVAGMSAGAALAAVLGVRYPRLVRGVVSHSGLACGAASNVAAALSVMRRGPDNDVARIADACRAFARDAALRVPLLVIQGDRDDVVAPVNGIALVDQYLRLNGHPAGEAGYRPNGPLPPSDAASHEVAADRYATRIDDWLFDGRVIVRHVSVEGLGHAWSGGDGSFAFADPRGPDALDLFERFAQSAFA